MNEKPRVAIFDLTSCEGCQLQIVNLEEDILNLVNVVDVVEWREGISDQSEEYDIAIIEGSVSRPEDAERVKKIRERAKILIAMGACACIGGVNKLKNPLDLHEVAKTVYGDRADAPHLHSEKVRAIDEVVKVDYKIPGCPIDNREFARVIKSLLVGAEPSLPNYPVCVECKKAGNVCRYELGEICLGPITRAGCGARCPSYGMWCFGCRGPAEDANTDAAREVMQRYGKTKEDLEQKMSLFGTH